MPSPVGHALGGFIVAAVGSRAPEAGSRAPEAGSRESGVGGRLPAQLWLPVAAAVAPDLDFLWFRHNMETHSLGAAVLVAVVVLAWTRGRDARLALLVTLGWSSHVLFDWLGSDTTPPIGVMALWPLNSGYYFADAYLFEAIVRQTHLPTFWSHNLHAVAWEVVLLAPLAGLAWWRRRRGGVGQLKIEK